MNKPLVSVKTLTFNHVLYIEQCIEGVLMQKTSFDYEIVIGEDFSTDGTREIVKSYAQKYPEIIKLIISDSNVGVRINSKRTQEACRGKYIAFCEGDDYWTDPYKLQKQVDFLEANPDYGLVHGDVNHLYQKTGDVIRAFNKTNNNIIPEGDIFQELIRPTHIIKTMTVCLRKDLLEEYYLKNEDVMEKEWSLIDISIWLMISLHSKIHYMDEVLSTYRLLPESMSRSKNSLQIHKFHQKIFKIREYYIEKRHVPQEIIEQFLLNKYNTLIIDAYRLSDISIAADGYNWLKINGKLCWKSKLLFFGLQHPLLLRALKILKK